jgi:hypothetical protein
MSPVGQTWRLMPKILLPQFNRLAMRSSICGSSPRIVIVPKRRIGRETFRRNDPFQRRKPVVVVGFASVRISGCLGSADLLGKCRCPFFPTEYTLFLQGERYGKGLRFPRLAEYWSFPIAWDVTARLRHKLRVDKICQARTGSK